MANTNPKGNNPTRHKNQQKKASDKDMLKNAVAAGAGMAAALGGVEVVNSISDVEPGESGQMNENNAQLGNENAQSPSADDNNSQTAYNRQENETEEPSVNDGLEQNQQAEDTPAEGNEYAEDTDITNNQPRKPQADDDQTNHGEDVQQNEADGPQTPHGHDPEEPEPISPESSFDPKYDQPFDYTETDPTQITNIDNLHVADIGFLDTIRGEDGDLAIVAIMEDDEGNQFYFADINGDGRFNEQINPFTGESLGEIPFEFTLGDLELMSDRTGGYIDPVVAQYEHGHGAGQDDLLADVVNTDPNHYDTPLLADNQTEQDNTNDLAQNEEISDDDILQQLFGSNSEDDSMYDEDVDDILADMHDQDDDENSDSADDAEGGHMAGYDSEHEETEEVDAEDDDQDDDDDDQNDADDQDDDSDVTDDDDCID